MLMGAGVTLGESRRSRIIGTQILFILYVSYGVNFVKCTYRMLFRGRESLEIRRRDSSSFGSIASPGTDRFYLIYNNSKEFHITNQKLLGRMFSFRVQM